MRSAKECTDLYISVTYAQLRGSQKVIFRQFVLARDLVALAVEGCTVIYGIWKLKKERIFSVMLKQYAASYVFCCWFFI